MNKKLFSLLLGLCCFSFTIFSANTENSRKVPIVVYTPFNFYTHLMDAFKFTEVQDYYLVSESEIYVYDNRYGTKYLKGEYQDRQMRLNNNVLNISKFKNTILSNDSCFFFSLYNFQKYDNQYIGIIDNFSIRFVDVNGNTYNSFEELVLKVTDSNYLDKFFDIYSRNIENSLYNKGAGSGFYEVPDLEYVITILENDYNFINLKDKNSTSSSIYNFMNFIHSLIIIDKDKNEKLKSELEQYIRNKNSSIALNQFFEGYIKNNSFDYIPLMTYNVSEVMKDVLSEEDYKTLSQRYRIHRNKTIQAYYYLADRYREEVYQGNISFSQPQYERFINYFLKNVLFQK